MSNIALPKKIEFKDGDDNNSSRVIIEPCYPGYGITLGNSIRRVLLSSLPGAAVVGVKIEGASHEFMNLPHVKEDILEIVLNLKELRLKVFTDEEVKLELSVHGKKQVLAGDISPNSQVEIVNKDLVIADITDMAGKLNMEIFVSRGKGYRPVESIENKKGELGYMEMDAVFSPVLSAGVKVENVRVGKMTNWDRLVIDIMTNGTITPKEAFEKSVSILVDQFSSLINLPVSEEVNSGNIDIEDIDKNGEINNVESVVDSDEEGGKKKPANKKVSKKSASKK